MQYYVTQQGLSFLSEKSISKMQRAGEFGEEGDKPKTAQAEYKQSSSLARAEASIARANKAAGYDSEGAPDDSATGEVARRKRMSRPTADRGGLRKAPSREAAVSSGRSLLRVPKPLKGEEETHKTAAVISRRARFTKALTRGQ